MKKTLLLSCALFFVSCSQTSSPSSTNIQKQIDSGTPTMGTSWNGGSFYDDFSYWGFNEALWERINNFNGSPFGCTFNSNNAFPDAWAQSSGKLNLRLDTSGTRCAEMKTRLRLAQPRSTIGGSFNLDNVRGTLASIFTFKRWDTGGGAWQEIDIEYLPSWPGAGNQPRLHVAVIYQASPTSDKYMYEGYINVGTGFLSSGNFTPALFNWDTNSVQWKYGNNVIFTMYRGTPPAETFSYQEGSYRVHVYQNNTYGGTLNVNTAHFPNDPTYIFLNYWRGDNSAGISQFMGTYPSTNPTATARYKDLFYTRW